MDDAERGIWSAARRRLFRPVDGLLLLVTMAFALGLRAPGIVQYLPFALGLVLFGLPHGALDHLVPARVLHRRPSVRSIGLVVVTYAVGGSAVVAAWFASPTLAFVGFIALTWFHWGQGDVPPLLARQGLSPSRRSRILVLVVRGALPMLVPLIAFPTTYAQVFAATTAVGGGAGDVFAGAASTGAVRGALAGVVVALGVAATLSLALDGPPSRRAVRAIAGELGEILLLAAFFAVVPPILAVGIYFGLWHSLRHIVRLAIIDPRLRPVAADGRFGRVLVGFTREAAPLTVAALALLVGLVVLLPTVGVSPRSLLGVYLVMISALTVPHVLVVTWMDRRQGFWRAEPAPHPTVCQEEPGRHAGDHQDIPGLPSDPRRRA